jgi:hypothetical protein
MLSAAIVSEFANSSNLAKLALNFELINCFWSYRVASLHVLLGFKISSGTSGQV